MKLVIIENETAHAELMQRSIRREFPDVQIDCFDEVGSCLGSLDEIDPDIIISDYLLPDMDGIKFLEELENSRDYLEIRRDQYSETQALRRTIECKALKARLSLNACLSRKKKFRCNPCRDCSIPVQLC